MTTQKIGWFAMSNEKVKSKRPTLVQIGAVLGFLPMLKRPKLRVSKWCGGKMDNSGEAWTPCEIHFPEISEIISVLNASGFIQAFDWPSWQGNCEKHVLNPKLLEEAKLNVLTRLLTTHVRKDRFCEGHFSHMVKCGHITAILERLSELKREMQSVDKQKRVMRANPSSSSQRPAKKIKKNAQ